MSKQRSGKINKDIFDYWNEESVSSMYDKFLIQLEINLISHYIEGGVKILDAGCGEGEGTLAYSKFNNVIIHGADFSETRLVKARSSLKNCNNVKLIQADFLHNLESLDFDYDIIITQRFLINLIHWENQKIVLQKLSERLNPGGKLLLLEGSVEGNKNLNEFRALLSMDEIPVKWHNSYIEDKKLELYLTEKRFRLQEIRGLSSYYLLTRGVRPYFDENLNWESEFNKLSASSEISKLFGNDTQFSKTKLWVFIKSQN